MNLVVSEGPGTDPVGHLLDPDMPPYIDGLSAFPDPILPYVCQGLRHVNYRFLEGSKTVSN